MNFFIAGDIFLPSSKTNTILKRGVNNVISSDFNTLITEADISIANYESATCAQSKYYGINKIGPILFSPTSTLSVIKELGFSYITLANNHIRDLGSTGIIETLKTANKNGINTVGAGTTKAEGQRPLFIEKEGLKVSIINICENEFSTLSSANEPQANAYNPVEVYYQIKEAKKISDTLLLIVHSGDEEYSLPSPRMQRDFRFFVDAGADVVICHHAHCYSGYEVYNNCPIFYGLGNFLFESEIDQVSKWNYGYAVELNISKKGSKASVDFILHPYKQGVRGEPIILRGLSEKERIDFNNNLTTMNNIIADPHELSDNFDQLASKNSLEDYVLSPYVLRISQALRARGILPSFISRKKRLLFTNLLRCEAHRDMMIRSLEMRYEHNERIDLKKQ